MFRFGGALDEFGDFGGRGAGIGVDSGDACVECCCTDGFCSEQEMVGHGRLCS
nr:MULTISPECIES: hypothetical protein [Prosthecochloris]